MRAAKEGHSAAVSLLLQAGASWMTRDEDGMQPLHFGAMAGSQEVCKCLLSARADPRAVDDFDRTAYECLPAECVASRPGLRQWKAILQDLQDNDERPGAKAEGIFGRRL